MMADAKEEGDVKDVLSHLWNLEACNVGGIERWVL
jgi:hypothetical protein